MTSHIDTLVLLLHSLPRLLHLSVEVGVSFVHAGVSALPQRRILLVLLAGGRLGHLAFQICFKFVQHIQSLLALDVLILDRFGGEEGRQAAPILIPYVNFLETSPVFVLHALDEGVKRGSH